MKFNFEEVKGKVEEWGEKDWKRMVDDGWLSEGGKLEVVNRYGRVRRVRCIFVIWVWVVLNVGW